MQRLSAALLAVSTAALAQSAAEPLRASHVVVPQRRAFTMRSAHRPIRIENVQAEVRILEQTATTTLEIGLLNPGRRQAEAVLLLPVPDGAAVHSFDFHGAAKEPTARLLRRDEARRTYNAIVARTRDPALLEFAGYGLVRTSVFPVPPGGRQKVRLTYNHVLDATSDRVDYVLPRSEALDADVPWDLEVDLKAKEPIGTLYSPSHELEVRRPDPRHVVARIRKSAPGSFRLSYLRARKGVSASLFAYPDPKVGGGYFLLVAGLPARAPEKSVRREVTLVLDRSGSMAGPKLDQVRAAALQVVERLDAGEAFNIIDYATTVSMLAPQPVAKDPDSTKRARAYLAALRPQGGTNIHDALVEALRQKPTEGTLPLVLFLTDGLPTIGQTAEVAIREAVEKGNPHKRRVFTFGVGHDVNAPLLDRIAETTRAATTYVDPDEDVEVKVADTFRRLYGPVLAAPRVSTLGESGKPVTDVVREPIPKTLPDLFEGDQLVLLGQYRGEGPLRFRLEGGYLGEARSFDFRFDLDSATTRNAFVPRLWASRRIAFLVDQIRQAGGAETGPRVAGRSPLDDPRFRELVDEILRLSTEFGILSEYTSFLATEGTDLTNWRELNALCGRVIDAKAVRTRWGRVAVAQARNYGVKKKQQQLDYYNGFLNDKLERVEITAVQQVCDRSLFKRGDDLWIDGRLVAERAGLEPDETVRFGTPRFDALLDELVKEGRAGVIAFKGEILLRLDGKTILVRNDFEKGTK